MEHIAHPALATHAYTAADQHGPGNLLRIVLAVLLAGAALLGWFLLRGYRNADAGEGGQDGGGRPPQAWDGEGPSGGGESRPGDTDSRTAPGSAPSDRTDMPSANGPGQPGSGKNHPEGMATAAAVSPGGDGAPSESA